MKVKVFLMAFTLLTVLFLGGCEIEIRKCIETTEPICLPLPQKDLEDMAKDIEKDVEQMLPTMDFRYWVEGGCIHACEYKPIDGGKRK